MSVNTCPECHQTQYLHEGKITSHSYPHPTRRLCPGSGKLPVCIEESLVRSVVDLEIENAIRSLQTILHRPEVYVGTPLEGILEGIDSVEPDAEMREALNADCFDLYEDVGPDDPVQDMLKRPMSKTDIKLPPLQNAPKRLTPEEQALVEPLDPEEIKAALERGREAVEAAKPDFRRRRGKR